MRNLSLKLGLVLFAMFITLPVLAQQEEPAVEAQQQEPQELTKEQKLAALERKKQEDEKLAAEFNSPVLARGNAMLEPIEKRIRNVRPSIDLGKIPSLFFTPSEESLIEEARLGLTTRPPGPGGLGSEVVRGPREIALGGIVYLSSGDWTIWLNGQKITPKRLAPEILDISVRKDYIKLKWFDAYTNQIFPIKLRTHQRFNLDTRIFLPGEASAPAVAEIY